MKRSFTYKIHWLAALLLAATLLFAPAQVRGQDTAPAYQSLPWVSTGGPVGGLGYDIRMDPRNPDIMYVTDAEAGVFKSTDGGAAWFPSSNGISARIGPSGDGIPVFSLTIDPNHPDTLWAGTQFGNGVFRSDDTGANWRPMSSGILERALTIRGFAVEPGNSDVVYLAGEIPSWEWNNEVPLPGLGLDMTKGAVYKTVNGGQHWERIWYGDNLARYILIHPENHALLYVSTGIFDREAANSSPEARDPGGVGILRSRDGGATWETLGPDNGINPDELYFGSLYMHPQNPDILLGAAGNDPYLWYLGGPLGAIYLTEDGGDSWSRVLALDNASAVEICAGDPDIVYAGSFNGIFRSMDGGHTWRELVGYLWGSPDVAAGFPIDMQCDPRDPMRLFVNNYSGGNFLTEDGGETWVVSSQGYTGALMSQIAVAQDDPARVYASARSGVFVTADGGGIWQGMSHGVARVLEGVAIAVNPHDSNHLLTTIGDGGPNPKLSYDGGQTWRDVDTGLWIPGRPEQRGIVTQIVFAPTRQLWVLAAAGEYRCWGNGGCEHGQGVILSRDGGETWEKTNLSEGDVLALAFSPQDDARVYASVYPGDLYRSNNGGQTWERVARNISTGIAFHDPDMPPPALTALAVDPANANRVYGGFFGGAVIISTDGGASWEPSPAGMPPETFVRDIAADAAHPGVVYAAAQGSGVYVSQDSGGTWASLNEGLRTRAAVNLALSADGSVLYAATEGGGVFRLGAPGKTSTPPASLPTPQAESQEGEPAAEPSGGPGLCPGAAALPFALAGLVWIRHRRKPK